MKTIAIACDHAGLALKQYLVQFLEEQGLQILDFGTDTNVSVDYPDFAARVAEAVSTNEVQKGILVCGTGIGMALTANRFPGVRAASLTDVYSTTMAREHNDLNVLCLGSRVVGVGLAQLLVQTFFNVTFAAGRHATRVNKIHAFENKWTTIENEATLWGNDIGNRLKD